jgi:CRP-like cAMP-binding protein
MNLTVAKSPFAVRLSRHYQVGQDDLAHLETVEFRQETFKSGQNIVKRGAEMTQLILLASGWANRCRYTPEGMRQIVHLLVPGDIVTPSVLVTRYSDHGITALTDVVVRFVKPSEMERVLAASKKLATAFWWAAEQEHGVLREQIVRLGRRSALHRVPHLFLELHRRLYLVDLASAESFVLPLTQSEIADTLGLSNVHVNRTLRKLVADNYIEYHGAQIRIPDSARLAVLCDFDVSHLHLDKAKNSVRQVRSVSQ